MNDLALKFDSIITLGGLSPGMPESLTPEQHAELAGAINAIGSAYLWCRKDHIYYIWVSMFNRGIFPREYAEELGKLYGTDTPLHWKTIANDLTTAKMWPPHKRIVGGHVTPAHHEALNGLEESARDGLILSAEENQLTVWQLRKEAGLAPPEMLTANASTSLLAALIDLGLDTKQIDDNWIAIPLSGVRLEVFVKDWRIV